jgi:hypothetical protein
MQKPAKFAKSVGVLYRRSSIAARGKPVREIGKLDLDAKSQNLSAGAKRSDAVATNMTPVEGGVTFIREAQIGSVYLYVTIDWGVQLHLVGVPAIQLRDGLGNNHNPEKAQPHISESADRATYVTWRFQSVPAFDSYEVMVPTDVAGITSNAGNTTQGGTYAAVPSTT